MTGGTVVILGDTGRNFAAGMSGGVAYVYNTDKKFASRCNQSMVDLLSIEPKNIQESILSKELWHKGEPDEVILKTLLEEHLENTGSQLAKKILKNWSSELNHFVKVFPKEYQRALVELSESGDIKRTARLAKH